MELLTLDQLLLDPSFEEVIFCGMSRAGKTTFASWYSQQRDLDLIDLDDMISKRFQKEIPSLFQSIGKENFLSLEKSILEQTIDKKHRVIALGGGSLDSLENQQLLLHQNVIYLYLSFEKWKKRLLQKKLPIYLEGIENAEEKLSNIYKKRDEIFQRISKYAIDYQYIELTSI